MVVEHVTVKFSGYWSEYNCGLMPKHPGVFCVYRAYFDHRLKRTAMRELLYVGSSANVHQAVVSQVLLRPWREGLRPDESLAFSCGFVAAEAVERVHAAMVWQHRPRLNAVPSAPPHPGFTVQLTHHTPLLTREFTVGITAGACVGLSAKGVQRWGRVLSQSWRGVLGWKTRA